MTSDTVASSASMFCQPDGLSDLPEGPDRLATLSFRLWPIRYPSALVVVLPMQLFWLVTDITLHFVCININNLLHMALWLCKRRLLEVMNQGQTGIHCDLSFASFAASKRSISSRPLLSAAAKTLQKPALSNSLS